MSGGLEAFVRGMPKAELHVHLEGSMRPSTLLALAAKRGVDLPASDVEGLRRWFRFRDFEHFVEIYLTCSKVLVEPEDFERLALDFLEKQAAQNIVYSEVHFTISTHVAEGRDPGGIMDALQAAQEAGRERWGIELRLIPDIVRNVPVDRADVTLEWALEGRRRGLVAALGLSGLEATHPNEPFVPHFTAAEREGLHRVAHAGEHAGPQAIRDALELARAERIGHGVRAVEDPSLVEELARCGVPLEVCPTSNLCLGVFEEMGDHSFDALYRAGVPVSVNSDDPPFFNTTLSDEYLALADAFGYDAETLAGLSLAGLCHGFLSDEETATREAEFRRAFADLGREHLGRPVEPRMSSATPPASSRGDR